MVSLARARDSLSAPSVALFFALFASQAGVLVLSPVLVDVAREFHVSTAAAGQLRLLAAPLAALAAVVVARGAGGLPLRTLLLTGLALMGLGAAASAAAPTIAVLALAQVPVWVGSAVLVTGGVAAAGAWSTEADRGRLVARALAGPPAAWIIGMPVIGLVGEVSWRLAFLAVPLPAVAVAAAALVARPRSHGNDRRTRASLVALLREPGAAGWVTGELLANAAWAGTLVFAGALFVEGYGAGPLTTGVLLSVIAGAYLGGNLVASRVARERVHWALLRADLVAAAAVALLWAVTPNIVTTVLLFAAAASVAAARTLWGTAHGFAVAPARKLELGAVRAGSSELGYLVGSAAGGLALAAGGFPLVGLVFGGLFAAAALPHLRRAPWRRPRVRRLALA